MKVHIIPLSPLGYRNVAKVFPSHPNGLIRLREGWYFVRRGAPIPAGFDDEDVQVIDPAIWLDMKGDIN